MTCLTHIVRALLVGAALVPAIPAGTAQAGNISFVSTAGSNSNACTLAAPCRSLQHAIRVTSEGGEIRILDSGFYGKNATINRSLTINGNGNTVLLGSSMTINKPGAVAALHGLTLNGLGASRDAIRVDAAATVHIEDCLIHGFGSDGISVAIGGELFVIGTTVRDNGGSGLEVGTDGIARIANSTFTANHRGVRLGSGAIVETRGNNTIRGNGTDVVGMLTPFPGL